VAPDDWNPLAVPTDASEYRGSEPVRMHPWKRHVGSSDQKWEPAEVTFNNPGAFLKPGHLLVTWQRDKSCYQIDPDTGRIEFLFTIGRKSGLFIWRALVDETGTIYCSYSGRIEGEEPFRFAGLGYHGGVIAFEHRELSPEMPWLPTVRYVAGGEIVDPIGFQRLADGRFLIAEMDDWGRSGSVFFIDGDGQHKRVVASGGRLVDPVKAVADPDDVVWIANGNQITQDGELLRVDPHGHQTVVVPKRGHFSGCMVDVLHTADAGELVVIRDNLPRLDNSSVEIVEKSTGRSRVLVKAEPGRSRFFSQGDVAGNILWVAESVEAKLLRIELDSGRIDEIDLSSLLGGARGVRSSFGVLESVSVVPQQLRASGVLPVRSDRADVNARGSRSRSSRKSK
jgi:hypothetical protein